MNNAPCWCFICLVIISNPFNFSIKLFLCIEKRLFLISFMSFKNLFSVPLSKTCAFKGWLFCSSFCSFFFFRCSCLSFSTVSSIFPNLYFFLTFSISFSSAILASSKIVLILSSIFMFFKRGLSKIPSCYTAGWCWPYWLTFIVAVSFFRL